MFTPIHMLNISFFLLSLFTRGSQVVKKGQNFVYVNIECPLELKLGQICIWYDFYLCLTVYII